MTHKQKMERMQQMRNSKRLATFCLANGDVKQAIQSMRSAKQIEREIINATVLDLDEAERQLIPLRPEGSEFLDRPFLVNGNAHPIAS